MYKKIYINEIIINITFGIDRNNLWKWKKKPLLCGLITVKKIIL